MTGLESNSLGHNEALSKRVVGSLTFWFILYGLKGLQGLTIIIVPGNNTKDATSTTTAVRYELIIHSKSRNHIFENEDHSDKVLLKSILNNIFILQNEYWEFVKKNTEKVLQVHFVNLVSYSSFKLSQIIIS